jgi:hypothetical protein
MGKLVFGSILLLVAILIRFSMTAVTSGGTRATALTGPVRLLSSALIVLAVGLIIASTIVVIGRAASACGTRLGPSTRHRSSPASGS